MESSLCRYSFGQRKYQANPDAGLVFVETHLFQIQIEPMFQIHMSCSKVLLLCF
uniref:Uncharacterized protein n=1 Tax=Anguilla anguilla TaxID=7936 RepID=A0A0E9XN49_ANGAN